MSPGGGNALPRTATRVPISSNPVSGPRAKRRSLAGFLGGDLHCSWCRLPTLVIWRLALTEKFAVWGTGLLVV